MKCAYVEHHASDRNEAQYAKQPMGSMTRTPKRSNIMPHGRSRKQLRKPNTEPIHEMVVGAVPASWFSCQ